MFTIVATIAGFKIPSHWGTQLEIALMAVGIGAAAVLVGSLGYALLVAPYQQRDQLRRMLKDTEIARNELASQPKAACSAEHAAQLKRIAARQRTLVATGRECEYQDGDDLSLVFEKSFRQHFPEVVKTLDEWDDAVASIAIRVDLLEGAVRKATDRKEVSGEGWFPDQFSPTVARCLIALVEQDILKENKPDQPVERDWTVISPYYYWHRAPVFTEGSDEQNQERKSAFESFVDECRHSPAIEFLEIAYSNRYRALMPAFEAVDSVMHKHSIPVGCDWC